MVKNKFLILMFLIAVFTIFIGSIVSANEIAYPNSVEVEFNGVDLHRDEFFVSNVAETVPVRVTFKAVSDSSDVRVRVYMEGHRDDVSARTDRFDIVANGVYTKLLNLRLPSDSNDLVKNYTLYVEIVSSTDRTEKFYDLKVQRESYTLEILSVDYDSKVSAGDVVPVNVVAKNNGFNRADDNYVIVSIPELGTSVRGYMGDLVAVENTNDDDEEDSVEKTVFLRIPENTEEGVYEMQIEVYNEDSRVLTKKLISVGESESLRVLAGTKSRNFKAGESVTYDLIIVNSGNDVKVFNLRSSGSDLLDIEVPSIITVRPDSSETVQIKATADEDAEGSYTFSIDVDGEDVTFIANVEETSEYGFDSTNTLIIVLVVIFVILLIVLIVLLVRRGDIDYKRVEEKSYY